MYFAHHDPVNRLLAFGGVFLLAEKTTKKTAMPRSLERTGAS